MDAADEARRVQAATALAVDHGLDADQVVIHQRANRLTLRLLPCDLFVRVSAIARRNVEVAEFEVDIARQLTEVGASIGELDGRIEPRVHERDGFVITAWTYYAPADEGDPASSESAEALHRLHAKMRQLDVEAPRFTDRVDEAQGIVDDPMLSPRLNDADRSLLSDTLRRVGRAVIERGSPEQLLHGEPHPGNMLNTASGLRFIDFETCCHGPIEFDIAHADDGVGDFYAGADQAMIRDCRILKYAMVAAWRSEVGDVFPNGAEMFALLVDNIRASSRHRSRPDASRGAG